MVKLPETLSKSSFLLSPRFWKRFALLTGVLCTAAAAIAAAFASAFAVKLYRTLSHLDRTLSRLDETLPAADAACRRYLAQTEEAAPRAQQEK